MRTGRMAILAVVLGLVFTSYVQGYIFEETFDSYTTGSTPCPPWDCDIEPGTNVTIDDMTAFSDKCAHFTDPGGGVQLHIRNYFTTSNPVVLEYYMRTHDASKEGACLQLQGDDQGDYGLMFGSSCGGGSPGYIGVIGGGGWPTTQLLPYSIDTWYYVRREINCATGTGYFYVEEIGNPSNSVYYSIGQPYPNTYFNGIVIWTSGMCGADCYVDEITVSGVEITLPYEDNFETIGIGNYPIQNDWQNLFSGDRAYVWHDPATAKNNQIIAYGREVNGGVTSSREIYLLDPITMAETRLTNNSWEEGWPSISPDGKKVAYTSNQDGNHEIYVWNIDGSGLPIRLTDNPASDGGASWSPDGEYIAFGSMRDGNAEIYIVKANGSELPENISNHSAADSGSDWSPDGKQIIFVSDRGGNQDIWVMYRDGSNLQNLSNHAGIDGAPAYSPNGDKIVFMSDRDGNREIYVMCYDGSNQTRLTNSSTWEENPDWSPDGKEIVYHSHQYGANIWKMNPDGTSQTRLTTFSGDTWPSWGAGLDGKSFRLVSKPTWSRTDYVALPEVPNRLTYEVSVYADPVAGRTAWVGFVEQSGGYGLCFNRFHIKNVDGVTGEIHFNTGQTGSSSIILGEFTIGEWVTVRADLDFDNSIASLWVNGELKEKYVPIAPKEFDDSTWGHIQLSKWGVSEYNWPPAQGCLGVIHIDDVKIIPFYSSYTFHVNGKCGNDSWLGLEPDCSTSHGPKKTIQAAIDAAWNGDTILVWPGVYEEPVDFLGKAITVRSAADAAVITQPGNTAVKFIHDEGPSSILSNFVIPDSNVGIFCDAASPTITHVTVVNNQTGIECANGSNPDISNSIFWDNALSDLINTTASDSLIQSCIGEYVDGLVGYWRLDEGSDTKVNDSSSNNYHGDIYGAEWDPDGLIFKGPEHDYVEFPGTSHLHLQSGFTLSAWVCFNTYNYDSHIVGKHLSGSSNGYFIGIREDQFCFYVNEDIPRLRTPDTYRDGLWHHVVGTYDGLHTCLYVDGVLEVEGDRDYTTTNNNNIRLGNPTGGPYWLTAKLAEISIFNKALTIEDIQSIFNNVYGLGYPLFADPTNDDYHLQSERGRYLPVDPNDHGGREGFWVLDEVTSPCIDAGDPADDASAEPAPNGSRVNQGAYGATAYASMSMQAEIRGTWPLRMDCNLDGIVNLVDFACFADEWLKEIDD